LTSAVQDDWTGTVPYRHGTDGQPRPYLWLTLTGPNGSSIPIIGLADSGADKTVLPRDYINLLGYQPDDLEPTQVGQVEGSAAAWDAKAPCEATVVGVEEVSFQIYPLFVDTLDPLWGRADFMAAFRVSVSERRQELGLHLPA